MSAAASAQITSFCTAAANSTGAMAEISAAGSTSAAANDLTLECTSLPGGSFGIFLVSGMAPGAATTPTGSVGNLCLGPGFGLIRNSILSTGMGDQVSLSLDLADLPAGLGGASVAVAPGDSYHFQYWFRDATASMATSNFSNGVSVAFDAPTASFSFDSSTVGLRYSAFTDTTSGNPGQIDWDFDYTGDALGNGFNAMVPGSPLGSVSHDFDSTGLKTVAMRAIFPNTSEAFSIQTVDVTAITFGPVRDILVANCVTCHTGPAATAISGLPFDLMSTTHTLTEQEIHASLVNQVSTSSVPNCMATGGERVDAFDPANSFLLSIAGGASCSMSDVADLAELSTIENWILQGAALD